jgi:hypothetical protein
VVVLAVVITNDPVQVRIRGFWTPVMTNGLVRVSSEGVWTPVITNGLVRVSREGVWTPVITNGPVVSGTTFQHIFGMRSSLYMVAKSKISSTRLLATPRCKAGCGVRDLPAPLPFRLCGGCVAGQPQRQQHEWPSCQMPAAGRPARKALSVLFRRLRTSARSVPALR